MMRRRRAVQLLAAITAVCLAAVLAVWYSTTIYLPHPSRASRPQLLRWLVQRDLARQPLEIRLALVDRLADDRNATSGWTGQVSGLSTARQRRLWQNIEILKHTWFDARVRQYRRTPPEQRMAMLQRQLDVAFRWATVGPATAGSQGDGKPSAAGLFDQVQQWLDQTPAPQHAAAVAAVRDAVVCWLATGRLNDYSMATRRELAVRIADYLDGGGKVDGVVGLLSPDQHRRLVENGQLLVEAWLHELAARRAALAPQQRDVFVDHQLDRIDKWGVLPLLAPNQQNTESGRGAALPLTQWTELAQQWIERAAPDEREQLEQLVVHLQQRLLIRQLRNMLPAAGSAGKKTGGAHDQR